MSEEVASNKLEKGPLRNSETAFSSPLAFKYKINKSTLV
jgi:hypothetical protein